MGNSIVKVTGLSHRYNVQWAIQNIDFDIRENGVYGLLGSNGAGKSTTMNIMCGVLKQTEGNVEICGINLKDNPVEAKKHIGFLPQNPPLHPDLNIYEYLEYCAELRQIPDREIPRSIDFVMERCGIAHFRKRLVKNLSGGYKQRLGIAQSIIHDPDLVVLDEPTNGLDPNQILEVRNLIKEIAVDRTVILSTHILSEVQATCKHIKMIENGKMVFSGSMDEFHNYIIPNSLIIAFHTLPEIKEIEKLDGVLGVEVMDNCRYRVKFGDFDTTADCIIQQSATRKWPLREIYIEKHSLDSIFAELSNKR